jgi:hypothetical protein
MAGDLPLDPLAESAASFDLSGRKFDLLQMLPGRTGWRSRELESCIVRRPSGAAKSGGSFGGSGGEREGLEGTLCSLSSSVTH